MRNEEGRTDFELVGSGITMQVHKILKCSEPFCKHLLSWEPEFTISLILTALTSLRALSAPQTEYIDQKGVPRTLFQIKTWWPFWLVNAWDNSRMGVYAKGYSRTDQRKFPLAGEVWDF